MTPAGARRTQAAAGLERQPQGGVWAGAGAIEGWHGHVGLLLVCQLVCAVTDLKEGECAWVAFARACVMLCVLVIGHGVCEAAHAPHSTAGSALGTIPSARP